MLFKSLVTIGVGLLCGASGIASSQTLAFPGAEGFGALATGGRGKPAVIVTNLNDDGPGSFRQAVSRPGATVVFATAGVIHLKSSVVLASDLTIAGQSAPGSGITIADGKVSLTDARNVIIRYLRFRGGIKQARGDSSLNLANGANLMVDHASIEWGRWDNIQANGNSQSTIQHSIIGQGIVPQRFGCLCQSDELTLSHNLWIDNKSRNPKAKGRIQYVNNVVYNWGVTGYVGGHSAADHSADVVANVFIAGPESGPNFIGQFAKTDHTWAEGNLVDLDRNGAFDGRPVTADEFTRAGADVVAQPTQKPQVPVRVDPASMLVPLVAANAGHNLCRDAVDQRLVDEMLSFGRSGKFIADETEVGGLPPQFTGVVPKDSDGDGMPDEWERNHHQNPGDAADGPAIDAKSGYSHLELYLNELAGARPSSCKAA